MKILQVYYIYPAIFGGVSKVVFDITNELNKKGHKVSVLTTDHRYKKITNIEIKNRNGITIYRFPTILNTFSRKYNYIILNPSYNSYVKKIIKNYDVIHFHGHRTIEKIIIHNYAKKFHIPYIVQTHGDIPRSMSKQRLKLMYDVVFGKSLFKNASKVIALSPMEVLQYKNIGIPEDKITVIPNGINLSDFQELPLKGTFKKKFKIIDKMKIILYLGRIHKIKGLDILVKAFMEITKKLEDIKLVIVGPDDGYLSKLRNLIKVNQMEDDILITGPLYGENKLEAYVDADIYVLLSSYEIWGLTVLEAYACGTPVIAARVGGLKNLVIDKVTGFLVNPNDVNQINNSIFYLLNNLKQAKKMAINGKQLTREKYDIEKVTNKLENLYKEIING